MRTSRFVLSAGGLPFPIHRDTLKRPRVTTEVGVWNYKKETMSEFQNWCRNRKVCTYGNVKITKDLHFARCLRATKTIYPGHAIITCPYSACFNFLTVAKEMYSSTSCTFPIQFDWINYNERLPYLKSTAIYELAMAGWMVRTISLEDSPMTPYIKYLLEDTRGRDGVANGISREREDASGMIDHYFSEMATEACEDPEVFLENIFVSFACIRMRTQPIEAEAIQAYIPGTNFFKAQVEKMFVPTLIPLIDTVVQREDGAHNTVVQYFPFTDSKTLAVQCEELQIPYCKSSGYTTILSQQRTVLDIKQKGVGANDNGMNESVLHGGGFFALRALQRIEKGELLFVRQYPFEGGANETHMKSNLVEANRLLNHHN